MNKQILIHDEWMTYELTYRKMKTIRIKVSNGVIKASAPFGCPIEEIEDLIIENQDKIIEEVEKTKTADYKDGGFVYRFGKKYTIILRDMQEQKVVWKDDTVIVYHAKIQQCIEKDLRQQLSIYVQEYLEEFVSKYSDFKMPAVHYRKSSARYGTCFYRNNKIVLNPILAHFKEEFIQSVVVHEMVHFKVPDHSKEFYAVIDKYFDNYQEIRKGSRFYD